MVVEVMRQKSSNASFGLQVLFSYITVLLNFFSVGLDYFYLLNVFFMSTLQAAPDE